MVQGTCAGVPDLEKNAEQGSFLWRSFRLVGAVGTANAVHDPHSHEFHKNCRQNFLGQVLLGADGLALDDPGGMLRKHGPPRQSVQSSLRNSHSNSPIPYRLCKSTN
jgi:hypothetical protein